MRTAQADRRETGRIDAGGWYAAWMTRRGLALHRVDGPAWIVSHRTGRVGLTWDSRGIEYYRDGI